MSLQTSIDQNAEQSCDGSIKSSSHDFCTVGGVSGIRCELGCEEPDKALVGPDDGD